MNVLSVLVTHSSDDVLFAVAKNADILLHLSPPICLSNHFCVCAFSLSIIEAVKHETLTQCQAIVGPSSTLLSHY